MEWLHDQFYHFNVLNILCVISLVLMMTAINKKNTTVELKSVSEEIYKNAEEIKDEIRDKTFS